jgi:hypothetical protein
MLILVALAALLFATNTLAAPEARCTALGANCVCSEPLNVPPANLTWSGGLGYVNDGRTTKRCDVWGGASLVRQTYRAASDATMSNDATALAAFPSGHGVSYFLRQPAGAYGKWENGGYGPASPTYVKRLAARWYMYTSANYEFRGDGTCNNSKVLYMTSILTDNSEGHCMTYNFTAGSGWTGTYGTTLGGPYTYSLPKDAFHYGPTRTGNTTKAYWRGKWIRVEATIINRAGGASPNGFQYQLHVTDVKTSTTPWKITDLQGGCDNCSYTTPANVYPNTDWTPATFQRAMVPDLYREIKTGGACLGWRGISHFMIAGWDTDTGQTIGASTEVEGGTAPPVVSTGLFTVWYVAQYFLILVPTLFGGAGIVLGLLALGRRISRHVHNVPVTPRDFDGGLEQPARLGPVVGPSAESGDDVQSVVLDARTDELDGVVAEVEGTARQGEGARQAVVR